MNEFFSHAGLISGYVLVGVLCAGGILLSGLSFSGTWLVAAAALAASLLRGDAFPGWKAVTAFLLLSAAIEVADTLAGSWGVKKRGGSGWAGAAALVGGILGMMAGSAVLPIIGSLLGLFAGCFLAAYGVEYLRLKETSKAAHIATGAVLARVAILVLKLTATLFMAGILAVGLLR